MVGKKKQQDGNHIGQIIQLWIKHAESSFDAVAKLYQDVLVNANAMKLIFVAPHYVLVKAPVILAQIRDSI